MKWAVRLLRLLRSLSYAIFWIALGAGTYARWIKAPKKIWTPVMFVFNLSLVVLFLLASLKFQRKLFIVLKAIFVVFCPCLTLGLLIFSQNDSQLSVLQGNYMLYLLLTSLAFYISCVLAKFGIQSSKIDYNIRVTEVSCLAGLILSAMLALGYQSFGVICSLLYSGILAVSFHKKAVLPVLSLPFYLLLSERVILIPETKDLAENPTSAVNFYLIGVPLLMLLTEPFVNIFVNKQLSLDLWNIIFAKPLCLIRAFNALIFLIELILLILTGISLQHHKEWWVIGPLFAITAAVIWLPLHIAYVISLWKLTSRMKSCLDIYKSDESRTMKDIIASRGIRHFSLISYPVMWLNLFFTVIQFIWSWTTMTATTCGLFVLCLPIQLLLLSLLRELSLKLGGTCCGFAMITPAILRRPNEENLTEANVSSAYASRTVQLIQSFFNHHLILDGGCHYSSDNMTEQEVTEKLVKFFAIKTKEGISYDSYLLYYSGPVNDGGDWILKGGVVFTYAKLLDLWMTSELVKTSRLILVLDTARSNYWVYPVRKTKNAHIAIQTIYVRREAEILHEFNIGDFTRDWVEFNCNKNSEIYSEMFLSPIVVTYGVSQYWALFRFQEPSSQDIDKHWQENFSVKISPLIKLLNVFQQKHLCCFCKCLSDSVSLIKMWAWPLSELDIGHGFKLVRFFRVPGGNTFL